MVTADMVKACYRVLLKREPENENVVKQKTGLPTLEALLSDFINSPEYKAKIGDPIRTIIDTIYGDVNRHIDYDVPPEQLAACFARIRREWTVLGEEEPYWSVSANDAFKLKKSQCQSGRRLSLLPGAPPFLT